MPFFEETPQTQLIKASKKGSLPDLKKAIADGANVNILSGQKAAINQAVIYGHLEIVKELIASGANINVRDSSELTTLMHAAKNNRRQIIKELLANGAQIDAQNESGETALFCAASNNKVNAMQELLENNADLSITRSDGKDILSYCLLSDGRSDIKKVIANHFTKKNKKAKEQSLPIKLKGETSECWKKVGNDNISFIGKYPELGYEITETFNFRSRQQIIVRKDLEMRAVTMSQPVSFNDLDKQVIEEVVEKFKDQGGRVNKEFALNGNNALGKNKKLS